MIRIALVDDEALVRSDFARALPWKEMDVELSHSVSNGYRLLELLQEDSVDLVFTDIHMPQMSGIEVISAVKLQFPEIMIVALSTFDDIDYVVEAFKAGAEDYILKSRLNRESVEPLLIKAKDLSTRETTPARRAPANILSALFSEAGSGNNAKELRYFLAIGEYVSSPESPPNTSRQYNILHTKCLDALREKYSADRNVSLIDADQNRVLLLVDIGNAKSHGMETGMQLMRRLSATANHVFGSSLRWAFIDESVPRNNLTVAQEKSIRSLELFFFETEEQAIGVSLNTSFRNPELLWEAIDTEYTDALIRHDFTRCRSLVGEFIAQLQAEKWFSVQQSKFYLTSLFLKAGIINRIPQLRCGVFLTESSSDPKAINEARTLSGAASIIYRLLDRLSCYPHLDTGGGIHPGILRLVRYVHDNKAAALTLDDATEIACLSRSYLSKIFHETLGETFTSYVNRVKIEHARYLIGTVGIRIGDAMETVGIQDLSYFGKLFKRYIGHAPSHYNKE